MEIYAAKTCIIQTSESEQIYKRLDKRRIKKISALKNQKEKERSIAAGLLLRYAFLKAGYDENAWRQAEIEVEQYGKPFIRGFEQFQYSLSHSGEWVVCASDTMPIGIDIQEMKNWKLQLAKRFYHRDEYYRLLAMEKSDTDKMTREFYSIWTAKESVVKLSGRGIGAGLSQYVTSKDYSYIYDTDNKQTMNTRLYDELCGYMVCVCNKEGNFPVKLAVVDFNNL